MENNATSTIIGSFLRPEQIIQQWGFKKGDYVADFGAGHGYFTIPIARLVGGDGRVYALDIQKPALEVVRAKAKLEHLLNVELMWVNLEELGGSHLKDGYMDFVVISNALFQTEKKKVVLEEALRVLRPAGRLALIEWDDATSGVLGPPLPLRVKKEGLEKLVESIGFLPEGSFDAGAHHYGLLFVKK